ncbi:hypothetical protein KAR91_72270, partial [Candidatus Pacearchaeota archaeon]|nr:hypothetical protein [Candidatus Pacearchaeota archaeon]
MQLISYSTENFKVASERTEGIPSHAVEIQGELIRINKRNLEKWGIKSSAVDGIIAAGNGIPIRMCNSPDPHDCDYKHDHYSDIGYVTKMWHEGDWIYSRAAITDKNASQKVKDGTWMPMNEGKWSVAGYPGSDIDDDGMLEKYIPASISFVPSPNKPAFEGSKFELVAAAVNEIKAELQLEHDKQSKEEDIMTDDKTDIKPDNPDKKDEMPDTKDVKEEPKVEPKTDAKPTGDEPIMYNQKEYDAKLAEALETQKTEFEEQMAQMTNSTDLETMLSAAKKETIKETLDEINRNKLTDEYRGLVASSPIIGAPFMVDGVLDGS